jgi:hypothetical protein
MIILRKPLRILVTLTKVFTVKKKMKVIADDSSFPIRTSHWSVFYMYTQEPPLCPLGT